jgi:formate hydrogenlyase subunit 4
MMMPVVNALLVLLLAPLVPGVINKTKAIAAGRKGPPLLQTYYDVFKLLRKRTVLSETTTWIFFAGPVIAVSSAIVSALFLPYGSSSPVISFAGDMLLFIYLFAFARFFVATAAMDTGSAFEGMGASREVTFSALAEPALLFGLLALARLTGSLKLGDMLSGAESGTWPIASASLVLVIISWFVILLAENSRVPFDDPNTHLELTMIHEVMVLDHSGPAFGFILYGAALKLTLFCVLIAKIIFPGRFSGIEFLDFGAMIVLTLVIGVAVGLVESSMARFRLIRIPQLLITATLLAAFAVVLLLR